MNADKKLEALAAWHSEWQKKWAHTVTVDSRYSHNEPSQYPETIVDMSASREAQDDYWQVATKILNVPRLEER